MRRSESQASTLPSTLNPSGVSAANAQSTASSGKRSRLRVNHLEQNSLSALPQSDAVKNARLRAMEVELLHYRNLLESMVKERTSMLECRLSILEHCNAKLGDNYHQMHQMYLNLLADTKNSDFPL